MKHRQYITIVSLIMALTGLSPVVAADAEISGQVLIPTESKTPHRYNLTNEQMDQITAGKWRNPSAQFFFNHWMSLAGACLQNEACSLENADNYLATAQGVFDNNWID